MSMQTSLLYRVLGMDPIVPLAFDHAKFMTAMGKKRRLYQGAPKIRLDNVAKHYMLHEKGIWYMSDMPNWAPPFGSFWVEWQEPEKMRKGDVVEEIKDRGMVGGYVVAGKVTKENRVKVEAWETVIAAFWGGKRSAMPKESLVHRVLPESGWILAFEPWAAFPQDPYYGRPVFIGTGSFIGVNEDGSYHKRLIIDHQQGMLANAEGSIASMLHVLGLGISFMHCKNVAVTEHIDHAAKGMVKHRKVAPTMTFKTLDISPFRTVRPKAGESEGEAAKRALHIARGHFATYTEAAPLFGKHTGTFWRPDHVRGSASEGQVVKDYNIK